MFNNTKTNPSNTPKFLNLPSIQPSPTNSLHSKSTPLRPPPLTPQSPRRSPNRWINTSSCTPTKTRRIRNHANHLTSRTNIKLPSLSLPSLSPMRSTNNQLNLPPPNRLKIPHCLLLRKPHRTSRRRQHNPNTLILFRGNNPNNLPRPHLLNTILSRQHKL